MRKRGLLNVPGDSELISSCVPAHANMSSTHTHTHTNTHTQRRTCVHRFIHARTCIYTYNIHIHIYTQDNMQILHQILAGTHGGTPQLKQVRNPHVFVHSFLLATLIWCPLDNSCPSHAYTTSMRCHRHAASVPAQSTPPHTRTGTVWSTRAHTHTYLYTYTIYTYAQAQTTQVRTLARIHTQARTHTHARTCMHIHSQEEDHAATVAQMLALMQGGSFLGFDTLIQKDPTDQQVRADRLWVRVWV